MLMFEIPRDLTVDDLTSLPETGYRYELHGGNLYMMSPATTWHTDIGFRLTAVLRAKGQIAYPEVGIKFAKRNSRTADVGVFEEKPEGNRAFFDPSRLTLVIEIVSPTSEDDDRIEKPRVYAKAGIPEYWRVERSADDPDDAIIFQHKLARTSDGKAAYIETGVTTLSALEADAQR